LWAAEPMVENPTNIDVDSRGRVWVTEGVNYRLWRNTAMKPAPGADRVKVLEDTDGDGKADKVTVFAENITPVPMGIAVQEVWQGGKLAKTRVFVGNSPSILVFEDTDGDLKADSRKEFLTGFGGVDHDHGVHGMTFGPDGKLYFTQGDGSYAAAKDEKIPMHTTFKVKDADGRWLQSTELGTVLRVDLDGKNLELLARRLRNDYETAVNSFGDVFVSDNDDDGNRGSRMVWILDGANYGYRTTSRHWAEEVPGVMPKLAGTGNGSPCGILVYEGNLLPSKYYEAVLQIDAGTHQINFHPLVRRGSGWRTDYEVLLKGDDPWFRPVDASTAPDGSLIVADWYDAGVGGHAFADQNTGRLYRLAPKGHAPSVPNHDAGTPEGLTKALASPNVATWMAAREALVALGAAARPAVQKLADAAEPVLKSRALYVLADLPETGTVDLYAALKNENPRLRESALRRLTRDARRHGVIEPEAAKTVEPRSMKHLAAILPLADDADAGVRRELLTALRDVPTDKAGPAVEKLVAGWDGQDRFYLEVARLALVNRESAYLEKLFAGLSRKAVAAGWSDGPLALPPYFPVTTNDAFLHSDDQLPPANAASIVLGTAWVLGRPEALPAISALLSKNTSLEVERGVGLVLDAINDPRAAAVLTERFAASPDLSLRRDVLKRLGSKLGGAWSAARDADDAKKVFTEALAAPELRVEAIQAVARAGIGSFAPTLLSFVESDAIDVGTRGTALEALGRMKVEAAKPLALKFAEGAKGQSRGGPLAVAALAALADLQGGEGAALLENVAADDAYPIDYRQRAVQVLAGDFAGAERLAKLAKDKKLPVELTTDAAYLLHNHPDRRVQDLANREFPLPKPVGGAKNLADVLALAGDVERGRAVFARNRSDACIRCHRVQGVGQWVGPDLSSIGTKYGRPELLYHTLNPSGAIGYNYVPSAVALTDGRVLTGLVTSEAADRIVLKTAAGERIVIPTAEIEARRAQNKSIMPENLADAMSAQDLADLVQYLLTLRQPVSTVGEYYVLGPAPLAAYDPAQRPDVRAAVDVNGKMLRWQRTTAGSDDFLDLSGVVGGAADAGAFCVVPVVSSQRQPARVVLTAAGAVEAWLNGEKLELAAGAAVGTGGDRLLEAKTALAEGPNNLVVRVAGGEVRGAGLVTTIVTDRELRFGFDGAAKVAAK
ncbi:MAG: PVC-type heme-binding CxxCH protein, partial [Planctomycetia bacterium]